MCCCGNNNVVADTCASNAFISPCCNQAVQAETTSNCGCGTAGANTGCGCNRCNCGCGCGCNNNCNNCIVNRLRQFINQRVTIYTGGCGTQAKSYTGTLLSVDSNTVRLRVTDQSGNCGGCGCNNNWGCGCNRCNCGCGCGCNRCNCGGCGCNSGCGCNNGCGGSCSTVKVIATNTIVDFTPLPTPRAAEESCGCSN